MTFGLQTPEAPKTPSTVDNIENDPKNPFQWIFGIYIIRSLKSSEDSQLKILSSKTLKCQKTLSSPPLLYGIRNLKICKIITSRIFSWHQEPPYLIANKFKILFTYPMDTVEAAGLQVSQTTTTDDLLLSA